MATSQIDLLLISAVRSLAQATESDQNGTEAREKLEGSPLTSPMRTRRSPTVRHRGSQPLDFVARMERVREEEMPGWIGDDGASPVAPGLRRFPDCLPGRPLMDHTTQSARADCPNEALTIVAKEPVRATLVNGTIGHVYVNRFRAPHWGWSGGLPQLSTSSRTSLNSAGSSDHSGMSPIRGGSSSGTGTTLPGTTATGPICNETLSTGQAPGRRSGRRMASLFERQHSDRRDLPWPQLRRLVWS